jgi:hypothetical protein
MFERKTSIKMRRFYAQKGKWSDKMRRLVSQNDKFMVGIYHLWRRLVAAFTKMRGIFNQKRRGVKMGI